MVPMTARTALTYFSGVHQLSFVLSSTGSQAGGLNLAGKLGIVVDGSCGDTELGGERVASRARCKICILPWSAVWLFLGFVAQAAQEGQFVGGQVASGKLVVDDPLAGCCFVGQ